MLIRLPEQALEAKRPIHESIGRYDMEEFDEALAAAVRACELDPLPGILIFKLAAASSAPCLVALRATCRF